MKKTFAVLFALAVCCSGSPAFASHEIADADKPAAAGSIEVYGAAKMSVDVIDTDSKTVGADTSLAKVSSNSSRVGFKGAEEIGDGLKAIFQVELSVKMDDVLDTGLRNTYVGISSSRVGTLLFGVHDTPYKTATGQFDAFGDTMGDYNAIIGNVNGDTNFELRPKNVIAYATPSFAGVQVTAARVENESTSTTAPHPRAHSFSATYKLGALAVALAHESHKHGINAWDVSGKEVKGTRAGAGYTLEATGTKFGVVYETLKNEVADSAVTRDAIYATVSQKIGKETIKVAFGKADDGKNPSTETGAAMTAVGIDHAFSKRTSVYALFAKTKNDANATYGLGQGGAGGAYKPAAGEDPSVVSIGMNHSF